MSSDPSFTPVLVTSRSQINDTQNYETLQEGHCLCTCIDNSNHHPECFDRIFVDDLFVQIVRDRLSNVNNSGSSSNINISNSEEQQVENLIEEGILDVDEENEPECFPVPTQSHTDANDSAMEEEPVVHVFRKLQESEIPKDRTIFCQNCTKCTSCICKKNKLPCTVRCKCEASCKNMAKEKLLDNWSKTTSFDEKHVDAPSFQGPNENVKKNISLAESFSLIWTDEILTHIHERTNRKLAYLQKYGKQIQNYNTACKAKHQAEKRKRTYTCVNTPSPKRNSNGQPSEANNSSNNGVESSSNVNDTSSSSIGDYENPTKKSKPRKNFPEFKDYLLQCKQENVKLLEKFTKHQIQAFLNVCMIMAMNRVDNVKHYWASEGINGAMFGRKIIQTLISRRLFNKILSSLSCDEDFLEDMVNENSRKFWNCFKEVSVDELIAPFKGKVKFKQFIPTKPHRYGLKYYAVSDLPGYIYGFWLYKGKKSKHTHTSDKIVLDLVSHISNPEKHILGVDNFYGSLALAQGLSNAGWNYVMTVKNNRPSYLFGEGLQKELTGTKTKEWTFATHKTQRIAAISINDNKRVNFLSNIASNQSNNGQPVVQQHYNASMGCVDRSGIFLHKLDVPFKTKSWKVVHLLELFRISVINQYLIYKYSNSTLKLSLLDYVKQAVTYLTIYHNPYYKRQVHFPQSKGKRSLCAHCKNSHSFASFSCPGCSATLHLDCFIDYHTSKMIYY